MSTSCVQRLNTIVQRLEGRGAKEQRETVDELLAYLDNLNDQGTPPADILGQHLASNVMVLIVQHFVKPALAAPKRHATAALARHEVTLRFRRLVTSLHQHLDVGIPTPPFTWKRCGALQFLLKHIVDALSSDAVVSRFGQDFALLFIALLQFKEYAANTPPAVVTQLTTRLLDLLSNPAALEGDEAGSYAAALCAVCSLPQWPGCFEREADVEGVLRRLCALIRLHHSGANVTGSMKCHGSLIGALRCVLAAVCGDRPELAGGRSVLDALRVVVDVWHMTHRKDAWRAELLELCSLVLATTFKNGEATPEALAFLHASLLPVVMSALGASRCEFTSATGKDLWAFPCPALDPLVEVASLAIHFATKTAHAYQESKAAAPAAMESEPQARRTHAAHAVDHCRDVAGALLQSSSGAPPDSDAVWLHAFAAPFLSSAFTEGERCAVFDSLVQVFGQVPVAYEQPVLAALLALCPSGRPATRSTLLTFVAKRAIPVVETAMQSFSAPPVSLHYELMAALLSHMPSPPDGLCESLMQSPHLLNPTLLEPCVLRLAASFPAANISPQALTAVITAVHQDRALLSSRECVDATAAFLLLATTSQAAESGRRAASPLFQPPSLSAVISPASVFSHRPPAAERKSTLCVRNLTAVLEAVQSVDLTKEPNRLWVATRTLELLCRVLSGLHGARLLHDLSSDMDEHVAATLGSLLVAVDASLQAASKPLELCEPFQRLVGALEGLSGVERLVGTEPWGSLSAALMSISASALRVVEQLVKWAPSNISSLEVAPTVRATIDGACRVVACIASLPEHLLPTLPRHAAQAVVKTALTSATLLGADATVPQPHVPRLLPSVPQLASVLASTGADDTVIELLSNIAQRFPVGGSALFADTARAVTDKKPQAALRVLELSFSIGLDSVDPQAQYHYASLTALLHLVRDLLSRAPMPSHHWDGLLKLLHHSSWRVRVLASEVVGAAVVASPGRNWFNKVLATCHSALLGTSPGKCTSSAVWLVRASSRFLSHAIAVLLQIASTRSLPNRPVIVAALEAIASSQGQTLEKLMRLHAKYLALEWVVKLRNPLDALPFDCFGVASLPALFRAPDVAAPFLAAALIADRTSASVQSRYVSQLTQIMRVATGTPDATVISEVQRLWPDTVAFIVALEHAADEDDMVPGSDSVAMSEAAAVARQWLWTQVTDAPRLTQTTLGDIAFNLVISVSLDAHTQDAPLISLATAGKALAAFTKCPPDVALERFCRQGTGGRGHLLLVKLFAAFSKVSLSSEESRVSAVIATVVTQWLVPFLNPTVARLGVVSLLHCVRATKGSEIRSLLCTALTTAWTSVVAQHPDIVSGLVSDVCNFLSSEVDDAVTSCVTSLLDQAEGIDGVEYSLLQARALFENPLSQSSQLLEDRGGTINDARLFSLVFELSRLPSSGVSARFLRDVASVVEHKRTALLRYVTTESDAAPRLKPSLKALARCAGDQAVPSDTRLAALHILRVVALVLSEAGVEDVMPSQKACCPPWAQAVLEGPEKSTSIVHAYLLSIVVTEIASTSPTTMLAAVSTLRCVLSLSGIDVVLEHLAQTDPGVHATLMLFSWDQKAVPAQPELDVTAQQLALDPCVWDTPAATWAAVTVGAVVSQPCFKDTFLRAVAPLAAVSSTLADAMFPSVMRHVATLSPAKESVNLLHGSASRAANRLLLDPATPKNVVTLWLAAGAAIMATTAEHVVNQNAKGTWPTWGCLQVDSVHVAEAALRVGDWNTAILHTELSMLNVESPGLLPISSADEFAFLTSCETTRPKELERRERLAQRRQTAVRLLSSAALNLPCQDTFEALPHTGSLEPASAANHIGMLRHHDLKQDMTGVSHVLRQLGCGHVSSAIANCTSQVQAALPVTFEQSVACALAARKDGELALLKKTLRSARSALLDEAPTKLSIDLLVKCQMLSDLSIPTSEDPAWLQVPIHLPFAAAEPLESLRLELARERGTTSFEDYSVHVAEWALLQEIPGVALQALSRLAVPHTRHRLPQARALWANGHEHNAVRLLSQCSDLSVAERVQVVKWVERLELVPTKNLIDVWLPPLVDSDDTGAALWFLATLADRLCEKAHARLSSQEFVQKAETLAAASVAHEALRCDYESRKSSLRKEEAKVLRSRLATENTNLQYEGTAIAQLLQEWAGMRTLAMETFIRSLSSGVSTSNDVQAAFRLVSLWFDPLVGSLASLPQWQDVDAQLRVPLPVALQPAVDRVPRQKLLCVLPQLAVRITSEETNFLPSLVARITAASPQRALWHILALKHGDCFAECDRGIRTPDEKKIETAKRILKALQVQSNEKVRKTVEQALFLAQAYLQLAFTTPPKRSQDIKIDPRAFILGVKNFDHLSPPTLGSLSSDSATIVDMNKTYRTVGGIHLPKLLTCSLSDGSQHLHLLKSQDDLRQDALIEQFFTLCNYIFERDDSFSKAARLRTYNVVPLAPTVGLVQWLGNCVTFNDVLVHRETGLHHRYFPHDLSHDECRDRVSAVAKRNVAEKLRVYEEVADKFTPAFHTFFFERWANPKELMARRHSYAHSLAASSLAGHVVGLGDRHIGNLLVNKATAEVIHIDLGLAFEQGKTLPVPEIIPFRLTRDLVDGLGVLGVAGPFARTAERVLKILQRNAPVLTTVLEAFVHEPLADWSVQAQKEGRTLAPLDAQRTMQRIHAKLQGHEGAQSLGVHGQIRCLISEATSPANLSQLFCGWSAWA